jgi:hypothetical protein
MPHLSGIYSSFLGKKKGPNLAVWACKSILREDGGDNLCAKKIHQNTMGGDATISV